MIRQNSINPFIKSSQKHYSQTDKKVLVIYASGAIGAVDNAYDQQLKVVSGGLENHIRQNQYLCDLDYAQKNQSDLLVTPLSSYNHRTWYKIIEMNPIQHSRQIKYSDVKAIAELILQNYSEYFGFIVLFGISTITYAASILSFMLENLDKTIILTGAQVPICFMRNDAQINLLNSITLAGHFVIPEVLIVFGSKGYRGNRCRNIECDGFDCIGSPNFPPLVYFGINVEINWSLVLRKEIKEDQNNDLKLSPDFCVDIIILKITPFMSTEHFKSIFENSKIKACIFECYHFGEVPHSKDFLQMLKEVQTKGIIVLYISQCIKINNENLCHKSIDQKSGITIRCDITPEAALAKLGYLLGYNYNSYQIAEMFQQNLQGEIESVQTFERFEGKDLNFIQSLINNLQKNTGDDQIVRSIEFVNRYIIPNLGSYLTKIGSLELIKELKKFNSDLSLSDYDGRTMLHTAVQEQNMTIAKYLIEECKVNINPVDYNKCTPMFEALQLRNKEFIFYLKQNGGVIQAPKEQLTELLLNAALEGDLEFISLAFYSGLKNLNDFINIDSRSIGHIAVQNEKDSIIEFLKFHAYFDFNQKDRWGKSPIDYARQTNKSKIIHILECSSQIMD